MLLKIDSGWGRGMWLVVVAMLVLGVVVRRRHYGCSCAYGLWHWHGSVRYGPARSGPVWLSSVQPGFAWLVVIVVWTVVAVVLAVVLAVVGVVAYGCGCGRGCACGCACGCGRGCGPVEVRAVAVAGAGVVAVTVAHRGG